MWAATPSRCAIRSVLLRLALVVPCACFVLPAAPRATRPSRLLATLEKPSGPGRLIIVDVGLDAQARGYDVALGVAVLAHGHALVEHSALRRVGSHRRRRHALLASSPATS